MSKGIRAAFAAAIVTAALGSTLTEASARTRNFPLTQCGPGLAYLCPIHGFFDAVPFTYSLAIYPGCLKRERVETPEGIRRRLVLVCG